jgi:hypothetical protein
MRVILAILLSLGLVAVSLSCLYTAALLERAITVVHEEMGAPNE